MKLIILRNNIREGLSIIERAVGDDANLPILKNVLIKAESGNKLSLSATNLEIGIDAWITGKIIEEGNITVPFATLHTVIGNSDSDRINMETKGDNLMIKTDNYDATIQGLPPEDFPIIPKIENKELSIEIKAFTFKDALQEIISAAQISEIRPEISGILFDFQLTAIKLVATDSFRLAEKTLFNNQFQTNIKHGYKIIIPLKTVHEVIRSFKDDDILTIQIDPHQILFKTQAHQIISRLINGTYPDYEQIIPKVIENEIVVNREKLLNAVKLVGNFSGKSNDIQMRVKNGISTLEVFSIHQHLGENSYLIPIKAKKEINELSFNWKYLFDGLKALKGEIIILGINGDAKPAILKPQEDASYFYLAMPIKST
ncbi:MAG: DNA polymerase III subunit beta [Patescibacteria group bacterium]